MSRSSDTMPAWSTAELTSGWTAVAQDAQISATGLRESLVALFAETAVSQVRAMRRGMTVASRFAVAGTPDGFAAAVAGLEQAGRETMRDLNHLTQLGAAVMAAALRPVTEFLPQTGGASRPPT
jgi:hypothetical protein